MISKSTVNYIWQNQVIWPLYGEAKFMLKNTSIKLGRPRYTFTPAGESESMLRAFHEKTNRQNQTPEKMQEIAV